MKNIFQYLYDKKGKQIPLKYKLLYNLLLNENDLIVNGNLDLGYTKIKTLPHDLIVNGFLDLACAKITSLPNNLTVNGWLNLSCTNISSLPNNLTVNGSLDLDYSKINSLPNNLTVNGNLWCMYTPLANNIKKDVSLLTKYSNQIKGKIIYDEKHLSISV